MKFEITEKDDIQIDSELRFNSLFKSYKNLLLLASNGISNKIEFDKLYDTLQEIWIFGNGEQAELATMLVKNLKGDKKDSSLSDLISSIYSELRSKLHLPILETHGSTLTYTE